MTKRNEPDEEYKGDPSASWRDRSDSSDNDFYQKVDDHRDTNRIDVRDLPEDKIEKVDLNKPLDVSDDPILNTGTFTNRTGMAWWSLYMMVGLVIVLFFFLFAILGFFMWKPEVMKSFTNEYKVYLDWSSTFIGWGFSAFSAVILAYMGATSFFYSSYMKNMKK